MKISSYTSDFSIVSCDYNGEWLPDEVEQTYEVACNKYNASYFGFSNADELLQFVKDYYIGGFVIGG